MPKAGLCPGRAHGFDATAGAAPGPVPGDDAADCCRRSSCCSCRISNSPPMSKPSSSAIRCSQHAEATDGPTRPLDAANCRRGVAASRGCRIRRDRAAPRRRRAIREAVVWRRSGQAGGSCHSDARRRSLGGDESQATASLAGSSRKPSSISRPPIRRLRSIGRASDRCLDEAGYLTEDAGEIADRARRRRRRTVEDRPAPRPGLRSAGIGARDLAECLAIQLTRTRSLRPPCRPFWRRLDLVAARDFAGPAQALRRRRRGLADMLAEIRSLDPKPGRAFGGAAVEVLVPDVFVRAAPDGGLRSSSTRTPCRACCVNRDLLCRRSSTAAQQGRGQGLPHRMPADRELARPQPRPARHDHPQGGARDRPPAGRLLSPGRRASAPAEPQTVADAIGMHESTVSRVTSNKAVGSHPRHVPDEVFLHRRLTARPAPTPIPPKAVRLRIRQLIDGESGGRRAVGRCDCPAMKAEGIDIARRTVAKYRESLRIPSIAPTGAGASARRGHLPARTRLLSRLALTHADHPQSNARPSTIAKDAQGEDDMTLRVSGKNLDIGEAFRSQVEARVAGALSKYFDGGYSGHVTVARTAPASAPIACSI